MRDNLPALPGDGAMQVIVLRDAAELAQHTAAWDDLAACACESNVFYESWMLLPAVEAFGAGRALEWHLVFEASCGPDSPHPLLCGLFPMERRRRYKGLPVAVLTLWKHLYCLLCTPLVRSGREAETLAALLDYCASENTAPALLEWNFVAADGAFGQAMTEVLGERRAMLLVDECWTRAFLHPDANSNGDDYVRATLSGKRRKELKRQENRLAETGLVQHVTLETDGAPAQNGEAVGVERWLEIFLQLEASGWKGQSGTAFACDPVHREFFRQVCLAAHRRGQLLMTELRVDNRAIATTCNLLSGEGAFAWKIAFDENYARFSPGVLLEIECIRHLHDKRSVRWIDSCAVRDHVMINRLLVERRTLQNIAIATGRGRGEFVLAVLPLLRWLKRRARHIFHTRAPQSS